jgi:PIN domain nuclease of toxin-antitoxin system
MTNDANLSNKAKNIFLKADNAQVYIIIPCIVLFELLYLTEKKKVIVNFGNFLTKLSLSKNYKIEPMCLPVIEKSRLIPRKKVADPWDRLIAATSMYLNLPLITKNKKLQNIGLNTI